MGAIEGEKSSHEETVLVFMESENVTGREKDPQGWIGVWSARRVVRVWCNTWANTPGRIADPSGTLDACWRNSTPPNEIQGRMVEPKK